MPGSTGDQGSAGVRGRPGPPGPQGLGGCPPPNSKKLSRQIKEVGHIFTTITQLYEDLGIDNQMSADEFYDYIMKKPSIEKNSVPNLTDYPYDDKRRPARSIESSTSCNGTAVIPGPKGNQGVPGLAGIDGVKGDSGIPGKHMCMRVCIHMYMHNIYIRTCIHACIHTHTELNMYVSLKCLNMTMDTYCSRY